MIFLLVLKIILIVWTEDDGVYSVIHNITKAPNAETSADSTGTTAVTSVTDNSKTTITGWVQNADNTWNYILEMELKRLAG